jgi:hypothetical protein
LEEAQRRLEVILGELRRNKIGSKSEKLRQDQYHLRSKTWISRKACWTRRRKKPTKSSKVDRGVIRIEVPSQ